ncbi:MAG TPA: type I phosphomannose isomerase catalytic subunit [Fibrobacteria bacterium]|nr:type I phosphomannose isomerase catalytic subunit [Fibrobacteria bacterium]
MVMPAGVREPLKLKPILMARLWGGDALFHRLGKGAKSGRNIGESWELSDRDGAASVVSEGPFAGQSLREIFPKHARDILGEQYSPAIAQFPLLYKFIDAKENLSVQVHPGEGSPLGESKTECWYVLEAPPEANLILGMSGTGPRGEVLRALASRDCLTVLNRVPVKAGDLFFIPAGTVHAITAGLLLYEVQQNSDTTFRLYDWDRVDPSGKPRSLHVQEAFQVIDFRVHDKHRIRPLALPVRTHKEEVLVACRHFALKRLTHCRHEVPLAARSRFRVVTAMRGSFTLAWDGGSASLALGETALVPAVCPNPRLAETVPGSEAVVSFLPDAREEIARPLLEAGHDPEAVRDLGGVDGLAWD